MSAQSASVAGRHEVEDLADALRRRGDDVEVAQVQPALVRTRGRASELGLEVASGDPVDLVDGRRCLELGEHGAGGLDVALVARGRVVARTRRCGSPTPMTVPMVGIEVDEGVDPSFGDARRSRWARARAARGRYGSCELVSAHATEPMRHDRREPLTVYSLSRSVSSSGDELVEGRVGVVALGGEGRPLRRGRCRARARRGCWRR